MRIKSEIYYQYYPLTDPRDLYKLEKIIFGPSWHEMASTEEVMVKKVASKPWTYHKVTKMVVYMTARPATWQAHTNPKLL